MSTVEHIEATLNAGRQGSYYRPWLNDKGMWQIVCGCGDRVVGPMEYETKAEAETAIMGLY